MGLVQENNKKAERSDLRRAAAPLAVALILLLAGCAGAGGGGDASPDSPNVTDGDTDTNTSDTSDTSDTTDEADNTEQIDADFADKFTTNNNELNTEFGDFGLSTTHEESLVENYESFTVDGEAEWDGKMNWDEGYVIWGQEDANGFIHHERVKDAPGEQVWTYFRSVNATESKRIMTDNGTQEINDISPNVEPIVGGEDIIRDNTRSTDYEFSGYKDDNGTAVAVFTATEPTDWLNEKLLSGSADSVEGELWIAENGVIQKTTLTAYSDDDVVYDSEFRVTNINNTETQPPSWAEDYAEEYDYYENQ